MAFRVRKLFEKRALGHLTLRSSDLLSITKSITQILTSTKQASRAL